MGANSHVKRKTGIFSWFGYRIPIPDRIQLIREAGFETILHWWDDSFAEQEGFSKEEQTFLFRDEGLFIENAHFQFDQVNDIWLDTINGQELYNRYLSDIDSLAACEIPVAVLHPSRGFDPPPISAVGMHRIHGLTERADKRGIRIAMENVSNNQALLQILDTIHSPSLGLCYDSGHDYIWSENPYELLKRYQDRLFAVHLHDNLGQNDDHLPIGSGRVDWNIVRNGIENSIYNGSYTLEGDSEKIPPSRTPQEHLKLLYKGIFTHLLG